MNTGLKFIIVDDDAFNNLICSMIIKSVLGEVDAQTFTVPEDGLKFIQNQYTEGLQQTILFVDINMPSLNGWEFLELYEKLDEDIKMQFRIYLLSSSVDQRDKDKAKANKYVRGFISKPLDRETILAIAAEEF